MTLELETHGCVVIPRALPEPLLGRLEDAHDRVYTAERSAGRVAADGSLHLLGFLASDAVFLELLDLPAVLPVVTDALGWNIYVYHSHLDAHPPQHEVEPRWRWHQDGGRQNLELETQPTRPRLSLKVAYYLTDVESAANGPMWVLPGSHRRNILPRPAPGEEVRQPDDAQPILAEAGSAVIFDRRLWHARGDNTSERTRKALFVAYTYRWIRPRETLLHAAKLTTCPVRRQLLGAASDELGYWIPSDDDVPLRAVSVGPR